MNAIFPRVSDYAIDPSQIVGHAALTDIRTGSLIWFADISDPPQPKDAQASQDRQMRKTVKAWKASGCNSALPDYLPPECRKLIGK
jgi:hypothetical protein